MDARQDLRDELIAVLGAARELAPETDDALADAFLAQAERQLQPSRGATGSAGRKRRNGLALLRFGLVQLLVVLLVAPVVAFLITFPSDGILQHIDRGAIPPLYYVALVIVVACILATAYAERYSVRVLVTSRTRSRTSAPKP